MTHERVLLWRCLDCEMTWQYVTGAAAHFQKCPRCASLEVHLMTSFPDDED